MVRRILSTITVMFMFTFTSCVKMNINLKMDFESTEFKAVYDDFLRKNSEESILSEYCGGNPPNRFDKSNIIGYGLEEIHYFDYIAHTMLYNGISFDKLSEEQQKNEMYDFYTHLTLMTSYGEPVTAVDFCVRNNIDDEYESCGRCTLTKKECSFYSSKCEVNEYSYIYYVLLKE